MDRKVVVQSESLNSDFFSSVKPSIDTIFASVLPSPWVSPNSFIAKLCSLADTDIITTLLNLSGIDSLIWITSIAIDFASRFNLAVLFSLCWPHSWYSYYCSIIPWNKQHQHSNKSWMILSKASHNVELNELFRKLKCNHVIIIIIWIIFPNFICLYINVFSIVIRIRLPTRGKR